MTYIKKDRESVSGIYFDQIGNHSNLSPEGQAELFAELDVLAAWRLDLPHGAAFDLPAECMPILEEIAAHLYKLVIGMAGRYTGYGVPLDDLIQEGNIALLKAIWKFDQSRGLRMTTYATWWIRQAISRAVADQGRTIRVPVHMNDMMIKISRAATDLMAQTGRDPTLTEIATKMGLPEKKVQEILRFHGISNPSSLDDVLEADYDPRDGYNFLSDAATPPVSHEAEQREIIESIADALSSLDAREERIIEMRFGLNGHGGQIYTLEEIGQRLGLTRERIRQVEKEALKKLRHPMRSRRLRDYA